MDILKSSRHSKIAGDFGELLFLYWLSKIGFEVALIDHTGIDLIAYNPKNNKRYGISVKTRTRSVGTENEGVYVPKKQVELIRKACEYFSCIPYLGLVIDRFDKIDALLISYQDLVDINGIGKTYLNAKTGTEYMKKYSELKDSIIIRIEHSTENHFSSMINS
jgi:hypothetical protein